MAGQPTKYKEEYNDLAEKTCKIFGADDKKLAKLLDVCEKTINNWKKGYPEFLQSIKRGKDSFDTDRVEKSLLDRALGYEHEDTQFFAHKGEVVTEKKITKHYPPDVMAIRLWLLNRRPGEWKDKQEIEVGLSKEMLNAVLRGLPGDLRRSVVAKLTAALSK